MTIREQATAALAELEAQKHREEDARAAQNTKLVTQALGKIFDLEGVDFSVSDTDVVIEGLSLQATIKYYNPRKVAYFQLWGECLECGQKTWSRSFKDLAGLGALLEEFKPHRCACDTVAAKSTADVLADALRNLIDEVLEG